VLTLVLDPMSCEVPALTSAYGEYGEYRPRLWVSTIDTCIIHMSGNGKLRQAVSGILL
jgi:hypothetical protein